MGAQAKKKSSTGTRNADRRSGKAWKEGKSPETRLRIAKEKADAKRERKSGSE
jgi:hypothetical protein